VAQPVDRSILQEIVRIIEARKKVPERVRVRAREYLITYLEDHQRRLQDALHRYDSDRLNMLYGQLASKVKYQLLRRLPGRAAAGAKAPGKPAARRATAPGRGKPKASAPSPARKKTAVKRPKAGTSGGRPAKRASASRAPARTKTVKRKKK
jgi:hypothetical protein